MQAKGFAGISGVNTPGLGINETVHVNVSQKHQPGTVVIFMF